MIAKIYHSSYQEVRNCVEFTINSLVILLERVFKGLTPSFLKLLKQSVHYFRKLIHNYHCTILHFKLLSPLAERLLIDTFAFDLNSLSLKVKTRNKKTDGERQKEEKKIGRGEKRISEREKRHKGHVCIYYQYNERELYGGNCQFS